ncbi:MAG: PorT family protein [Tannerellaceae bacterium]|jgi:hypothetical protein|nr:PorT family protein [Tannerellaceae bacterium]
MKMRIPYINVMITAGCLMIFGMQSAYPRIYLGGKAGISRSSIVQKMDLDYRSGWSVGWNLAAMADVPVSERFSLRPELALISQGGSFLGGDGVAYIWEHDVDAYAIQPTFHIAYSFPILDVKMTVYAGPALTFQLSSKLQSKVLVQEDVPQMEQSVRSFDFAGSGGISVEYRGAFFSITTVSGLLDRRRLPVEGEGKVLQNNLTFSLGYFFR